MVHRDKIIKFCEEYLKVKDFDDYCVNGLQVEGAEKVERIITGVSLSKKLIEAAIKRKAQMMIVHHGIGAKHFGNPVRISGYVKGRLKLILENDINLCGFHLPLDANLGIGNGVSLAKIINLKNIKPLYFGVIGDLPKGMEFGKLLESVNTKLKVKSYSIASGPKMVKRIGIVTGSASSEFAKAVELGADTYISGDIKESVVEQIKETGINFINAGHYNTEKLGIKNLGELVAKKFKVKAEFVDVPNDV